MSVHHSFSDGGRMAIRPPFAKATAGRLSNDEDGGNSTAPFIDFSLRPRIIDTMPVLKAPRFKSLHLLLTLTFLFLWPSTGLPTEVDLGKGRPGDILYVHHAPDPVNVRNGNFYLPVQDYFYPCFGFPLEIYRSYNSVSTRIGPFGRGWTFNYDIQIAVGKGAGLRIVEADGFVNEYVPASVSAKSRANWIKQIIDRRRAEDIKYAGVPKSKFKKDYSSFRKKLESDDTFFQRQQKKYAVGIDEFANVKKFVSHERGTTFLTKTSTGYLRTTETGRTESYDKGGLLLRISDRNGNALRMNYDRKSRLTRVTDTCGQALQFRYSRSGRIIQATDSKSRKLSYKYDKEDRLVSAIDMDAGNTRFKYDKRHRMTRLLFADGEKTTISYHKNTGFVSKQVGPGSKITNYKYGKKGKTTWAEVKDNQGTSNRYEYIDSENKIIFVDSTGKKNNYYCE